MQGRPSLSHAVKLFAELAYQVSTVQLAAAFKVGNALRPSFHQAIDLSLNIVGTVRGRDLLALPQLLIKSIAHSLFL